MDAPTTRREKGRAATAGWSTVLRGGGAPWWEFNEEGLEAIGAPPTWSSGGSEAIGAPPTWSSGGREAISASSSVGEGWRERKGKEGDSD
jgi:hypothetical protein